MEVETHAQMDWENGTPIMLGPWMLGLGEPSPETSGYWEGIAADTLRLKRCAGCGKHHHPRRMFCDACPSSELAWFDASGRGRIYSFSVVHRAPNPEFQADAPYAIGLVELDEGVYFFSRFHGSEHGDVAIGAQVEVAFAEIASHGKLPVFHVAAAA